MLWALVTGAISVLILGLGIASRLMRESRMSGMGSAAWQGASPASMTSSGNDGSGTQLSHQ
jgi:hypothetical protein